MTETVCWHIMHTTVKCDGESGGTSYTFVTHSLVYLSLIQVDVFGFNLGVNFKKKKKKIYVCIFQDIKALF